ncbi:MAG TPA: NrfD/PsrC family molybdoenzyme membrane anchor subunit [Candidatus Nitrosotenuis sp.]|jgi:molybdopterin-containing oxidoreductase family membrane subunit|nr:NrfD/PsrC family molybdoenzyme membrane anchor subunit [Candidatus Nitrosotenuis sp.]
MGILSFCLRAGKVAFKGPRSYYVWLAFLGALIAWGAGAYWEQLTQGLIATNMRDQVSWAFYIGNFTFLVGIAAAAIIVVIPAYVYNWKPIKEICILGEILAISALVMCFLFVTVDIGRPDRVWHLLPLIGKLNWPSSLLAWDTLVLGLYFTVNLVVVSHLLWCAYQGRPYNARFVVPTVLLSIPLAISIHTVTAFIYNGMPGRPFWNASILAPRFIFSALCSGPAILLVVLQILQRTTRFEIKDEALHKIAELMAYAMFLNLFLLGAETFNEYYMRTQHVVHFQYLFFGLDGHAPLVPYAWASVACSLTAFLLFLIPRTRTNPLTLNLGCLLIYAGVYIEKGMGLVMPGFTPSSLGEIYEYVPTMTEIRIGAAVFSIGFLIYTLLTRVAVAVLTGELNRDEAAAARVAEERPAGPLTSAPRP